MRKAKNWKQPCPNKNCDMHGQMNQGSIISISTYLTKSGVRRIFKCKCCEHSFSETRDTVFFDLKTPEEKVIMALKMLLVQVSLSGISFVLNVKEETILKWLDRAYQKADEINKILLKDITVTEVQLDEMWSFVKRKVSKNKNEDVEETYETEDGKQWIWVSYAPEFRLILAMVVGPGTFENALLLIQITASIVLGIPCFFSDGFSCYLPALIECYHTIKTFPKTGLKGRPKKPVKEPHEDLVYGQVVKQRKKRRIVEVTYRIICGAQRYLKSGLKISTSLLERLNLTIRESLAPLGRKTLSFSKKRDNLKNQTVFFQAYYNFARPHMCLREKINESENLFMQKWTPRTPGMAAGLTDHVWTFRELLTVKFDRDP